MYFPIQIKFPYMSEFMFGSEHSESKLRGAAQFNYRVVLANGLAELCPGSFELKFAEKYSRYFTKMSHIWIGASFQKSKHCRTDTFLKSDFYPVNKAEKAFITWMISAHMSQCKLTSNRLCCPCVKL